MADRLTKSEMANPETRPSGDEVSQVVEPATKEAAAISRRELIKLTASLVAAAPLAGVPGTTPAKAAELLASQRKTSPTKALLFFTPEEFALVDELSELIIPTDAHSPGARAAQVAAYIDARLAESFEEEPKQTWRAGLKLIETISQEMQGRAFLQMTPEQRTALLVRISQNEMNPQKPEELFFKELKGRTAHAYYTSKIGIHQEMEYKGNTYLKEFVGYEAK